MGGVGGVGMGCTCVHMPMRRHTCTGLPTHVRGYTYRALESGSLRQAPRNDWWCWVCWGYWGCSDGEGYKVPGHTLPGGKHPPIVWNFLGMGESQWGYQRCRLGVGFRALPLPTATTTPNP